MENFKNNLIKKKTLGIVCNDAGGSELVSSWLLFKKNRSNFHLNGPAKKIFKRKINFKNTKALFEVIDNSDVIVTGTSLHSKNEYKAIEYSKKKKKFL